MGRWVTSKGRRIYIPDQGEKNPYAKKGDGKSKESFVVDYDLQEHLNKKGKAEEAKRKKRELADEADAYDRGHKEGSYSTNQDFSSKGTYGFKGEKAPEDLPRVTDEEAQHNRSVRFRGTDYQTQQVVDWDNEKKKDYVAGHFYVPKDSDDKGSFFVAKDGSMWHNGSDYLRNKVSVGNKKQSDEAGGKKESTEQAMIRLQKEARVKVDSMSAAQVMRYAKNNGLRGTKTDTPAQRDDRVATHMYMQEMKKWRKKNTK